MFKRTTIFWLIILVYITHYTESKPQSGLHFSFGFGGKHDGKADGGAGGKANGGAGGKANGGGGGEKSSENSNADVSGSGGSSISGSFSFGSIIKSIANLPIKMATLPVTATEKGVSFSISAVKKILQSSMSGLSTLGDINADVVAKIIGGIEALIGSTVKGMTSTNIFGLQVTHSAVQWFIQKMNQIMDFILKLITWAMAEAHSMSMSSLDMLRVKPILDFVAGIPGIKQIVGMFQNLLHWNKEKFYENYVQLGKFLDSIYFQHKDFFDPIFKKILSVFLAFTNGIQLIQSSGEMTDISATLEGWSSNFGSMMSNVMKTQGGIVLGGGENCGGCNGSASLNLTGGFGGGKSSKDQKS